ncbi:MAG: hypothetical protein U5K71_10555 [Gracilimonas sp.]|nr:hypothetical protein [Gracilimonas sp.]
MKNTLPEIQTREYRIHRIIIRVMLLLLTVEWFLLLLDQSWLSLFLVTLIIITVFSPILFRNKLSMEIPAELHLTAVIFVFASFYLGEVQDFYYRVWWWDMALHTSAGLLMGILGFILVYVLNESNNIHVNLTPGFTAFFAFTFALAIGSVWEIFEFGMDQLFGMNMQKEMMGDPSGLTDTMWDIIVNAIGAFLITFAGYGYLHSGKSYFVKDWIKSFIDKNPNMFKEKE